MGLYPFILFGRKEYYGAYHTLVFFPFFSSSTFQLIFLHLMLHLFRGLKRKRNRNSIKGYGRHQSIPSIKKK
ncbi:Uncharacterized protein APZ42_008275 [Daphnia magna]|uniref:Uncharacterized protein n=1 Tax=Daphnia magna TaxID=35525 RepID=A0A162BT03_9CRUS|nr:Uncharacterized protein APZ42_008275 [Daphnia magna]